MKYYFQIAGTFTGRVSVPLKSFNAGVICSSFHTMTLSSSSVGKSTKGMLQVVDRMAPPAINVTVRGVVKLPKLTRTRYAANKRVLANMSLGPPGKHYVILSWRTAFYSLVYQKLLISAFSIMFVTVAFLRETKVCSI